MNMNKQYDLLRLIVQKMEIRTEDDNRDEGFSDGLDMLDSVSKASKWNPAKHNLLRQRAIVAHWKTSTDQK